MDKLPRPIFLYPGLPHNTRVRLKIRGGGADGGSSKIKKKINKKNI